MSPHDGDITLWVVADQPPAPTEPVNTPGCRALRLADTPVLAIHIAGDDGPLWQIIIDASDPEQTSVLSYDEDAMADPPGGDLERRIEAWRAAAEAHPDWMWTGSLSIPHDAWWVSLAGAGTVLAGHVPHGWAIVSAGAVEADLDIPDLGFSTAPRTPLD